MADYQYPTGTGQAGATGSTGSTGPAGQNAIIAVSVKTADYNIVSGDVATLFVMNSTGAHTFQLPASPPANGWHVYLQNENTGLVTVDRNGNNIDDANANLLIVKSNGLTIASNGSSYYTVRGMLPTISGDISFSNLVATVIALQGNPVDNTALGAGQDGYVLTWNNGASKWVATAISALGGANASQLRGKNIASSVGSVGAGQDGMALTWVNANNDFEMTSPLPHGLSVVVVTASLGTLAIENDSVTMAKMFELYKITVDGPARVRLYSTSAARTADAVRSNLVPPTPGTQHGCIADFYLDTSDKYTWMCSPSVPGFNNDGTQAATIYAAITNLSLGSAVITVTLYYVPQES